MNESQKAQYESAAKRIFDAIGRADDGNEMRAFISGCKHADTVATNRTLDEIDIAIAHIFDGVMPEVHEKIIEELKKLRK